MKTTRLSFVGLALAAVFSMVACQKTDILPNTPPASAQGDLLVSFVNGSIPTNTVDSVLAEFTRIDALDKRFVKLDKEGSIYKMRLSAIPVGQWRISVTVHTQKGDYDFPRQYNLVRETRIPNNGNISLIAPNGRIDGDWNVRAVLREIAAGVTAVIAVNPADPYFEVSMKNQRWKYLYIDRLLSRRVGAGYENITGQEFDKRFDEGLMGYADFEHFRPFANVARSSSWNRFETYLTVADENNRQHTVYYLYQQ